jgi:hypothetical protein
MCLDVCGLSAGPVPAGRQRAWDRCGGRKYPRCSGGIYIYIHTYIHTYIYTYIHTYIHTYIYIKCSVYPIVPCPAPAVLQLPRTHRKYSIPHPHAPQEHARTAGLLSPLQSGSGTGERGHGGGEGGGSGSLEYRHLTAESLYGEGSTFDLVVCSEVTMHMHFSS